MRLSWWPSDWLDDTTLQLTVKEAPTGAAVAVHHKNLADRDERKMMLGHWKNVAAGIRAHFDT